MAASTRNTGLPTACYHLDIGTSSYWPVPTGRRGVNVMSGTDVVCRQSKHTQPVGVWDVQTAVHRTDRHVVLQGHAVSTHQQTQTRTDTYKHVQTRTVNTYTVSQKTSHIIYFLTQYPEQLQCNITAGQPGTNKWILTAAQLVHMKSNTKNTKALWLCVSSPNINRFSKLFHWYILWTISNNVIIEYPATR